MTKAFKLNFSTKALFFLASLDYKKRLSKLVRQSHLFMAYTLSRTVVPMKDTRRHMLYRMVRGSVLGLMLLLAIPASAQIALRHIAVSPVAPDSADLAYYGKKNFWRASGEVVGFNIGLWAFDRYVQHGDWSYINIKTIIRNFREGFKWDNDKLGTNTFLHPYNGSLFYNAGRSNGYNFWQSELFAIGGSAMWEMFMENEYPSTNDIIATPIGGAVIGETTFRASDAVLDDRTTGWQRFGRETAAFIINPMRGLNRIFTGQAWRVRATSGHIFGTPPIAVRLSAGVKLLEYQGRLKNMGVGPAFQIDLEYGDRYAERSTKPYDYFTLHAELQAIKSQPLLSQLEIKGRLLSRRFFSNSRSQASVGLYQHFDFFDSDTIDPIVKVPYKLGIPASVGAGIMYRDTQPNRWSVELFAHSNLVILGSILSDHYFEDERNYNWASGFSLKCGFNWSFNHNRMSLSLANSYYRLFTWSGYKYGTNLKEVNFRTLNVQGDKSVSYFNITEARFDFKIWKRLYGALAFTNYVRSTHYRDYWSVLSSSAALRFMLSYKL